MVGIRLRAQRHVSTRLTKPKLRAGRAGIEYDVVAASSSIRARVVKDNLVHHCGKIMSGESRCAWGGRVSSERTLGATVSMTRGASCRCSLTALSINTALKRFPRIWSAASLPLDAFRLSAAPRGGALVLCQNLLLFHSQVIRLVQTSCVPMHTSEHEPCFVYTTPHPPEATWFCLCVCAYMGSLTSAVRPFGSHIMHDEANSPQTRQMSACQHCRGASVCLLPTASHAPVNAGWRRRAAARSR